MFIYGVLHCRESLSEYQEVGKMPNRFNSFLHRPRDKIHEQLTLLPLLSFCYFFIFLSIHIYTFITLISSHPSPPLPLLLFLPALLEHVSFKTAERFGEVKTKRPMTQKLLTNLSFFSRSLYFLAQQISKGFIDEVITLRPMTQEPLIYICPLSSQYISLP